MSKRQSSVESITPGEGLSSTFPHETLPSIYLTMRSNAIHPALAKCNGQDISRKKTKGKNRIMVILPAQIALKRGTEGQFAMLEKADTDKPDLVIETIEVSYCHSFFLPPAEFL